MATSPRGYPLVAVTDVPNGPTQINGVANAVDNDLTSLVQARHVTRTTPTSVANNATFGAGTIQAYDATVENIGGIGYAAGVLTPSVAGLYRWDASVQWAGSANPYKAIVGVNVNGSASNYGFDSRLVAVNQSMQMASSGPLVLAVNDQVQLFLFQNCGTGMNATPYIFGLVRLA